MKTFLLVALMASLSSASALTIPCDNPKLFLAPYAWRQSGSGDSARAEATLPGAYFKADFTGSATVGAVIDGTGNVGVDPNTPLAVEWSVDQGPFQTAQLTRTEVYTLPLAQSLAADKPHHVEFYFRYANLEDKRWTAPTAHLRLAGLALDAGGSLTDCPRRKKLAVAYGDSITEGVGVESRFTDWRSIGMNNAMKTWFPLLASALDCEYGQLGSSGLGMAQARELPPLPKQVWDHYDKDHSRLQNGLLLPEPDYVFNNLGTNDPDADITAPYTQWLGDARKACPHARFFCIVPLLGVHRSEITAAVAARHAAGDARVYLIDLASLQRDFHYTPGGTALAYEGVHPSAYGHAVVAAHLAVEVQKILDSSP